MMMKGRRVFYKISSLFLVLLIALGSVVAVPVTASAEEATTTKNEKSYDIAVVFDNSGSMYEQQRKSWCRAKYAMEIFASMLDYDKDKLQIFPMWEVTTDGSKPPEGGGSYKPISITSKKDIDKISNLYSVKAFGTPFAPVKEAHEYLQNSQADEKWLIILTDGEFKKDTREEPEWEKPFDLKENVLKLDLTDIKVQYLGIGEAKDLKPDEAKNFYAKKSTETSLKDDLIEICNSIFQRDVLPSNRLSGKTLNLDLSMKNVIVFVQGANAKVTALKNSAGKEIAPTLDSGQRKYSEISSREYPDAGVDKTLSGQVVRYTDCAKGKYTLEYSNADSVQIFYEPDVDIDVTLLNSKGEKVDGTKGEIYAGDYTITSKLVDRVTREDISTHELMGNVTLKTFIKSSQDTDYTEYENSAKISLVPDSSTEIYISGTYLNDYTITSEDSANLDWLKNLKIVNPKTKFDVKAEVTQEDSWYILSKSEEWQPIKVTLSAKGKPLTDAQLKKSNFAVSGEDELNYRCEMLPGESAYNVYIGQDKKGNFVKPETGSYELTFTAEYTDKYGDVVPGEDKANFEIQLFSKLVQTLIRIAIALGIIALIAFILTRKAWPFKMAFIEEDKAGNEIGRAKIKRRGDEMIIFPVNDAITVKVKKSSKLYQKFSKSASVNIVEVTEVRNMVTSFTVEGLRYSSGSGFKNNMGETLSGKVYNSTAISAKFNDGFGTAYGRISIN